MKDKSIQQYLEECLEYHRKNIQDKIDSEDNPFLKKIIEDTELRLPKMLADLQYFSMVYGIEFEIKQFESTNTPSS